MLETSVNEILFLKLFLKVLLKKEYTVWKLRLIIKFSSALIFDLEIFTSKLAKHWFGLNNQIAETGKKL